MLSFKIETEDLLQSISKNCETLIKQTYTIPQETSEKNLPNQGTLSHLNQLLILVLTINC